MATTVALLSDSHNHLANVRAALALLQLRQPAQYLHLGDVCDPEVLELFAGLPLAFVFGNNDFDKRGLRRTAERLQLECLGHQGELVLAGKRFALLHGDDHHLLHRLLESQQYDYVLSGHTHQPHDARHGRTRAINPGALQRARTKTVAMLEIESDALEFLPVPVDPARE